MKVIVNNGRTVIYDGKTFKNGDTIEMKEDEATRLFLLGFVTPFKEPEEAPKKTKGK